MAQETTEFVPALEVFPWSDTGAPDPALRGIRPLGNLLAVIEDGAVAIPAVGANQAIRATITLPPNFMYALQDVYVSVGGAGLPAAGQWDPLAVIMYLDNTAGDNDFQVVMPLKSEGAAMAGISTLQWVIPYCMCGPVPRFLQKAGSVLTIRLVNPNDDDIAVLFDCTLNFLRYTVAQEFDAGVNTPVLTR